MIIYRDYNYDYIRNTETELTSLSDTINNSVIKSGFVLINDKQTLTHLIRLEEM